MGISYAVAKIFYLIYLFLLITILLSYFPNIKWYNEPFRSLKAFSEIFLGPFRRIIPPVGRLDFSPVVAFIVLSILSKMIIGMLVYFGL